MLAVISPAKKLDFAAEPGWRAHSLPEFLKDSEALAAKAKTMSRSQLKRALRVSDKLADLNHKRFQAFATPFTAANARPAAWAFAGDTYVGLDARSFDDDDMAFAQDHLRILSGLYGLLRPLDLIQPYRLEMGAAFPAPAGGDLYGFWNGRLAEAVEAAAAGHRDKTVVNLASQEYFKALAAGLRSPVVTPVFKEVKSGQARVLGLYAKRARGAMARYMIRNRVEEPGKLKAFAEDRYRFRPELSDDRTWVYTRGG
jgi:hypothetical protein